MEFAREKDEQVITQETVNEVKDYVVLPHIDKSLYWKDVEKNILDNIYTDVYIKSLSEQLNIYQKSINSWKSFFKDQGETKNLTDYVNTMVGEDHNNDVPEDDIKAISSEKTDKDIKAVEDDCESTKNQDEENEG